MNDYGYSSIESEFDLSILERFQTGLMKQFLKFVSSGQPYLFLKYNKELQTTGNINEIQRAIDTLPDPTLKGFLDARLEFIRDYRSLNKTRLFT